MNPTSRMSTDEVLRTSLMIYQALDLDLRERVHASVWEDLCEVLEPYGIDRCMPMPAPYSGANAGALCLTCGPAPELVLVTLRHGVPSAVRVELHTVLGQA